MGASPKIGGRAPLPPLGAATARTPFTRATDEAIPRTVHDTTRHA